MPASAGEPQQPERALAASRRRWGVFEKFRGRAEGGLEKKETDGEMLLRSLGFYFHFYTTAD
jgi:hypothetical protein